MSTPHLHSVIVSYKRPACTEDAVRSYLETVTLSHTLVVVDNGSPADVVARLAELPVPVLLLGRNWYPGYATNRGWQLMPPNTTILQRIDNDTRFLPGWCEDMLAGFADSRVGQYGPVAEGDEEWTSRPRWPVGGRSMIRRELYDAGLRYDESPWTPGAKTEDQLLTEAVWAMGYQRVFGSQPTVEYLPDDDPEYRVESNGARGLP